MASSIEKEIKAKERSLREILSGKKYTVDYFQREYKWGKDNIEQLISDLTSAFLSEYDESHKTTKIKEYNCYYMGPIVLSNKDTGLSIIDGQQRITSLTLLLIFLNNITEKTLATELEPMIYSNDCGQKSFNLQIKEREICLRSLFESGKYQVDEKHDDNSIKMMAERYNDIENTFPIEQIKGNTLQSFVWWLIERVVLVEIMAYSDKNAYMIFETMNDRGLSLSSAEMLKGYILSKFRNTKKRDDINDCWKKEMQLLYENGNSETIFFQSWLRSQFAETIRQNKIGAQNEDFENIGTRFHNWFRDNIDKGLLKTAICNNIDGFVENNYRFYLNNFLLIKEAEQKFIDGLEHVRYISCWNIADSLAYPLMLSPLTIKDSSNIVREKIEIVAKFIDGFTIRRSVNFKNFGQTSIRYTIYSLIKEIRHKNADKLRQILSKKMQEMNENLNFENLEHFHLHGQNKRFIKYFLSRITSFVDYNIGVGNTFDKYMFNHKAKPFEIEHIWSKHFKWHKDEFEQENEFDTMRNTIGDLILLPQGINQSFSDKPYLEKQPHYIKENILAQSLCSQCYNHNPNFINFIKKSKLKFVCYTDFKKQQIIERSRLYAAISNIIWNFYL